MARGQHVQPTFRFGVTVDIRKVSLKDFRWAKKIFVTISFCRRKCIMEYLLKLRPVVYFWCKCLNPVPQFTDKFKFYTKRWLLQYWIFIACRLLKLHGGFVLGKNIFSSVSLSNSLNLLVITLHEATRRINVCNFTDRWCLTSFSAMFWLNEKPFHAFSSDQPKLK